MPESMLPLKSVSNSAVLAFDFGPASSTLRVKLIDGEPWFVAADACASLKISNVSDAVGRLDEDEKGVGVFDTPGGQQEFRIINESGLYSLIMRSNKPEAKAFKRWVTGEVLPSIRKTGRYDVSMPRTYAEALRAAADEAEKRELAEREAAQAWGEVTRIRAISDAQEEKIRRDEPKVAYIEHFVIPPSDTCLVRALAKELGVRESQLWVYLVAKKRVYRDPHGQFQPYAAWMTWFALRDQPEAPRLHNGQMRTTLYVKPVGKEGIRRMLARDPIS